MITAIALDDEPPALRVRPGLARAGRAKYKRPQVTPRKLPGPAMAEKPESDEFDDEADEVADGEDSLDVDRLMQDLDKRKRGAARHVEEPAWRRLERMLEQKRTSELLSDFDDYDIGEVRPPRKG